MAAAAVSLACPLRRSTRLHPHRRTDHDDAHDSDPENELTPRALRALKRQRLALDPDGLPLVPRPPRAKRRRKDPHQRPSTQPSAPNPCLLPSLVDDSRHSTATDRVPSLPDPPIQNLPSTPNLSIPDSPSDSEPLTPLTPLTPSPESSPSLPGHDRQPIPPTPSLDAALADPPTNQHQSPTVSFTPPPPLPPLSPLDPALDTLIPFDSFHPQFDPELPVQIPPSSTPPQLQGLQLQAQFHSFTQHQLYVPPNPVLVRDREINIWKLACQERVDCLLRRYGADYIKALVQSQARSSPEQTTQTKFRLYTPASYTYSVSSWGSTRGTRKPFSLEGHGDDPDPAWPIDDPDWVDADIDMEDEDEDDYEDDDDPGEADSACQGEATLEAVEGLVITDTMDVDDPARPTTKAIPSSDQPISPRSTPEPSLRSSIPIPHPLPAPPSLTPPTLPPLSSLHVPLLSEPPRSFMGRGTPPDRQRLVEWSGFGRFVPNGMGPPLYLSPVPQQHASSDVGIVPMSVDPPIQPAPPQPTHTHGEWTSFLYSMLEGDGVGVGGAGHAPEPTWYELGLASVPPVVPEPALGLPQTHTVRTSGPTVSLEQPVDEGSNSSSTLRFALG